jgi:uncharacterized protein (TIGR03435 family)
MNPHRRSRLLLAALALALLPASAQTHDSAPPQPSTPAAPDALGPAFEVATVKPSSKDGAGPGGWVGTRLMPSGRLAVRSMSVESLVYFAYITRPAIGKVLGGPSWVHSDRFDIEAKVDDDQMNGWDKLSDADRHVRIQPMMRTLLSQRFHLKLHTEMRETQVYVLVQAKGGSKLKQVVKPEELEGDGDVAQRAMRFMNDHPGQAAPGSIMCTGGGCTGHAIEMTSAVGQLAGSARADLMVIDQTGLTGLYDFSYTISHEEGALTPMQQIEDQLGLRFEIRKVPIKTYIIDSAEKPTQE